MTTTGMVAELVRHVGGDRVTVKQIMGAGVDPHLYKATRDDVQKIMQADLVFYSGLMLEGKMADVFVKVARSKPVYAVTELIQEDQLLEPEGAEGHLDPHVWMDVAAWSQCIDVVEKALSDYSPAHASEFQSRANEYRTQLEKLHEYGKTSIATIPESSRILITSHDAFNYFGRAYSLEVVGVQGLSTESEAGLQRINELVDLIVDRKVKAVFVESSVSRKNIMALVEGAQSKGHTVEIGGELFSDAMGPDGSYEGTYVGMLDHNITSVTKALGGTVPDGQFRKQDVSSESSAVRSVD
ncbi:zinc ABC transporter substrate-binding protein [Thalassoglobus sp. JC818]|uniref:metal ABC transporter solute-binding protein, Zn/Mn family n=1 Tax=Thalassoglobus sp. JC818 TaxID=3232136 RepID=UPI00345942B6